MRSLRLLLPLLLALLPLGCSAGSFRVGIETHSTRFQSMPSPESILAGEPRTCLVLPAAAPDHYSPLVNVSLSMAMRDRLAKVTAIPASHVASLANAHGLYPTVNAMIAGHATAGLLDAAGLARLHETFKVDFVLLPALVLVDRNEQTRLGFLGANLLFSSWTRVQVVLQLWRAEDGALAWQSVGGGSLDAETPSGIPASLQETLKQVFGVMVDDLLLGRSGILTSVELSERITRRSDPDAPAVEAADAGPSDATPTATPDRGEGSETPTRR